MELLYDADAIYGHASTEQPQKPCECVCMCVVFGAWATAVTAGERQFWIIFDIVTHTYFAGFYLPQRYILTFMGFMGLAMAYMMRLSLSVAITQMVPPPIVHTANLTTSTGEIEVICPYADENYYSEHFNMTAIFDQLYSVMFVVIYTRLTNY